MAFTKSISYKGITIANAYAKIVSYLVKEKDKQDNDNKKYYVNVRLVIYTDSTKTYDLINVDERLVEFESNNLNINSIYNHLKNRVNPVNENGEPLTDWSLWSNA